MKTFEEIRRSLRNDGMIEALGIEYMEVADGHAVGRLRTEARTLNPYGGVHGGCLFALADTIAGAAAMTRGRYVTTVSASVEYLSPAVNTEYIWAYAAEVKNGGTISVYDVLIKNDRGDNLTKVTLSYFRLSAIE